MRRINPGRFRVATRGTSQSRAQPCELRRASDEGRGACASRHGGGRSLDIGLRGEEAEPPSVHRFEEARLPSIVAEGPSQIEDRLREGILGDRDIAPYRVKQLALGDENPGTIRESSKRTAETRTALAPGVSSASRSASVSTGRVGSRATSSPSSASRPS